MMVRAREAGGMRQAPSSSRALFHWERCERTAMAALHHSCCCRWPWLLPLVQWHLASLTMAGSCEEAGNTQLPSRMPVRRHLYSKPGMWRMALPVRRNRHVSLSIWTDAAMPMEQRHACLGIMRTIWSDGRQIWSTRRSPAWALIGQISQIAAGAQDAAAQRLGECAHPSGQGHAGLSHAGTTRVSLRGPMTWRERLPIIPPPRCIASCDCCAWG
jgi:hypothetical protein